MRTVVKRSVVIHGHKTSVSLEHEFWTAFRAIARARTLTVSTLAGEVDTARKGNLSSAIRLFVLAQLTAAPAPAEQRAS